ncbi:MAG: HD-GYP domain-containing protein [Cyanobacteriota bacterium]
MVQVDSLDVRLAALHRQLLEFVPEIWRISCFLHDQEADLLRPFLFSSLDQQEVVLEVFQLSDHPDLLSVAENVRVRVLQERCQDCRSSLAVPMRSHVEKGVLMLNQIMGKKAFHRLPESRVLRNIVAYHHERMDGSGYPAGLVGAAIPVEARIVAVADVLDALSGVRPYRKSWSLADSVRELEREAACGKLDPHCVSVISGTMAAVEGIHARHQD